MVLTLAAGASAAVNPGAISGVVRNSSGTPQMGATVEVVTSGAILQAQTDAKGFYSLTGLLQAFIRLRSALRRSCRQFAKRSTFNPAQA